MHNEVEIKPKSSWCRRISFCICWAAGILVLYILSTGPLVLLKDRIMIRDGSALDQLLEFFYWPVEWAADNTPLEKPLGLYWHFWAPRLYDSKGNIIPVQSATERAVLSAISKLHLSYQSEEPINKNHRLSEWLAAYRGNLSFPDKERSPGFTDEQVEKALDAIGEKAWPFLIKWLMEDTSTALRAIDGFLYYGPTTAPLQPALIQMTFSKDPSFRDSGYEAFYFSQPDKDVFLPVAYRGLRESDSGHRAMTAQWFIQRFTTEADKAGLRRQYPQFYSVLDEQTNNAANRVNQ